jgi:hypothetical protein
MPIRAAAKLGLRLEYTNLPYNRILAPSRERCHLAILVATIIVSYPMMLRGPAMAAEASYQIGVSTAVFLTARDPYNVPFIADFALTSPKGSTRHARIASDKAGEATAQFGGTASNGAFGLPTEGFDMQTTGVWHWICRVHGRAVAHGSFSITFDGRTGHETLQTQPAEF